MMNMATFAAAVCGMAQPGRDFCEAPKPKKDAAWQRPTASELKGMYKYQHITSTGSVLACYLDYEPAEKQTHLEPGCSESIDLVYALADGLDVCELLDDGTIESIEGGALESMKMDKWNDEYDRGQARYEERMAA